MKQNWKNSWDLVMKKGNIWALAIGILVGSAFGLVVNSLANDLIMGAIAKAFNFYGVNFMSSGTTKWEALRIATFANAGDTLANGNIAVGGEVSFEWVKGLPINGIKYGKFLAALISFVIVVTFLVLTTFIGMVIWNAIQNKRGVQPEEVVEEESSVEEQILEQLKIMNARNRNESDLE